MNQEIFENKNLFIMINKKIEFKNYFYLKWQWIYTKT